MRVLHMTAEREEAPSDIFFDPYLVDGDLFFAKKNDNGMDVMCDFIPGFACHVLQRLKANGNYEEYLQFVIGSSHFQSITRGAQGNILEDALSYLLQKKTQPMKFALTGLDGGRGASTITSIRLDSKRYVQKLTTVPEVNDLKGWNADSEWYVGIPPEGFTGIDFVLARARSVGASATKKLEIFFIQTTVSSPQDHGVKKSTEQRNLIKLFKDKVGVTDQNTTLFVTFLTPKLGNGTVNDKMQYDAADYYHSKFQELEGNDPLVKIISEKCKAVWGA